MKLFLCVWCLLVVGGCHRHYVRVDPLTETEIIAMAEKGVPAEDIIRKIDSSGTVYIMDSKDVIDLHEKGVDQKVIDHMLETHRRDLERRARHYHSCPHYCNHPWYPHFGWSYYCW